MILIYNVTIIQVQNQPPLVTGEVVAMAGQGIQVVSVDDAEKLRSNLDMELKKNLVECLGCHEDVISTTEQPLKRCPCGALWVDGGLMWNKWGSEKDVVLKLVYSNE